MRVWGLPAKIRALLVTRMHDAEPDYVSADPSPTVWPLISALAVTGLFIGTIFTPWALVVGSVPVSIALIGWFWPKQSEAAVEREIEIKPEQARPASIATVEA